MLPNFTPNVTELINSNCDDSKTQLGQNSRTQIGKKTFKKSFNCNKTQNSIFDTAQMATKLNLNNKTKKL